MDRFLESSARDLDLESRDLCACILKDRFGTRHLIGRSLVTVLSRSGLLPVPENVVLCFICHVHFLELCVVLCVAPWAWGTVVSVHYVLRISLKRQ